MYECYLDNSINNIAEINLSFSQDISTVFTLLSAILHLTNITFVEDPETDGVQIDDEYPLRVGKAPRISKFILFYIHFQQCFAQKDMPLICI